MRWLKHADKLKPGVHMPVFGMLPEPELQAVAAYLDGLIMMNTFKSSKPFNRCAPFKPLSEVATVKPSPQSFFVPSSAY